MSAISPVSVGRFSSFSSQSPAESLETLQQALRRGDFNKTRACAKELLSAGRELIAQNVANGQGINPLPITLNLFELLNSVNLEWEEELKHDLIRVGRLFIELTCMKAVQENRRLSPETERKLKSCIDQLITGRKEDQVGLHYELICCQEAFKLMEQREAKESLVLVLKALAAPVLTTVVVNLLKLIPVILQKRHKIWYADSLYISWAGSTALNDLNLFQSIRNEFADQCSTLEIAQTFVELFGHLAWNGSPEVQMEALTGEPGLIHLSDVKKKQLIPLNRTMWPVRLRAVEILSSLTLHPNERVAKLATDALLDRRIRESNPKVLAALEKLESQPSIRERWKEQFEAKKDAIIEETVQAKDELEGKEADLKAKEADLAKRESLISTNNLEAQRLAIQERAALLKEREVLEQLRAECDQQSKNTQHLYQVMCKTANTVIEEILQSHSASTEPPPEFYCPVGGNIMDNPVMAEDGNTYDLPNIERWVRQSGKSPLNNQPISLKFIPNRSLKGLIEQFFKGNASGSSVTRPPMIVSSAVASSSNEGPALLLKGQTLLRSGDLSQAIIHFEQAANLGNSYAQFYMGFLYSEDRSPPTKQALRSLSSKGDFLGADLLLIWDYISSFHPKSNYLAAEYFEKAAENGVAIAQCYLAKMYEEGHGVDKDLQKAFDWFLKGAKRGNVEAQYNLGVYYSEGRHISKDVSQGALWITKAAEQGNASAQMYLGVMSEPKDLIKAFELYLKAAEQENRDATLFLSNCYMNGKGVFPDRSLHLQWERKAQEMGGSVANISLLEKRLNNKAEINEAFAEGLGYLRGTDQPKNLYNAVERISYAAGYGNPSAQLYLAFMYFENRDNSWKDDLTHEAKGGDLIARDLLDLWDEPPRRYPRNSKIAVQGFEKAAIQGNARAQHLLGYCYRNGQGVERDYKKAFEWFTKAADQEFASAQTELGFCFETECGVKGDHRLAFKWYSQAASQGNLAGMCNLANCYVNGIGILKDKNKAIEWYSKAAAYGDTHAIRKLKELGVSGQTYLERGYKCLREATPNPQQAVREFEQAAKLGEPLAQFYMGFVYEESRGGWKGDLEGRSKRGDKLASDLFLLLGVEFPDFPKNAAIALEYYQRAANAGNAPAQFALGVCYEKGSGVSIDDSSAVKWYLQAAENGYSEGQLEMGCLYDRGEKVPKNPEEAAKWFQKAADQNNFLSMLHLSKCFRDGKGVPIDLSQAEKWLDKAAECAHTDDEKELLDVVKRNVVLSKLAADDGPLARMGRELEALRPAMESLERQNQRPTSTAKAPPTPAEKLEEKKLHDISPQALFLDGQKYLRGAGSEVNIPKAISLFNQAAELGNPDAEFYIGFLHDKERSDAFKHRLVIEARKEESAADQLALWDFTSSSFSRDNFTASRWYQKAANQGNVKAQFHLAELYFNGRGFPRSVLQGIKWNQEAAKNGYAEAMWQLWNWYGRVGGEARNAIAVNYSEAAKLVVNAAENGHAEAQYTLGLWFQNKPSYVETTPRFIYGNRDKAMSWFRKAGEQGNMYAQFELGDAYYFGDAGVSKDWSQALTWYRKAAEQGYGHCMYLVGLFYIDGRVVQQNLSEACIWLKKASEQGQNDAKVMLSVATDGLKNASDAANRYLEKGEKLLDQNIFINDANAFFSNAADLGSPRARFYIGLACLDGLSSKTKIWLQKHADIRIKHAITKILGCRIKAKSAYFLPTPNEEAVFHFQKAADDGDMYAQYFLGLCYEEGLGVAKDSNQAIIWYRKSADQGNSLAIKAGKQISGSSKSSIFGKLLGK